MKTVELTDKEKRWIFKRAQYGLYSNFIYDLDMYVLDVLMSVVFAINRGSEIEKYAIFIYTNSIRVGKKLREGKFFCFNKYASEVDALKDAIKYMIKESGE
jgi:hypothetical protein